MGTALCMLPESPRWLMAQRNTEAAFKTITRLRHNSLDGETPRSNVERNRQRDELELLHLWSEVEKELAAQEAAKLVLNEKRAARAAKARGESLEKLPDEDPETKAEQSTEDNDSTSMQIDGLVPSAESAPAPQQSQEKRNVLVHTFGGCRTTDKYCFSRTIRHMLDSMKVLTVGVEKRAFRICFFLAMFNQLCASTAIINFAPRVLKQVGIHDESYGMLMTSALGGVKLLGVIFCMNFIDHFGRRPILINGSLVMTGCMVLLCIAIGIQSGTLVLASMLGYMMAFAASQACGFWIIVSELFSMENKAAAASSATAAMFLAGAISNFTFITAYNVLGNGAYLFFGGVSLANAIYVQMNLPETKGKTLSEIQEMLAPQNELTTSWWQRLRGQGFETLQQTQPASVSEPGGAVQAGVLASVHTGEGAE